MGVLSNKIQRDELKPGDHIYSWRVSYLYAHHGIYVGNGNVIHFTRGARQEIGTGTILDRIIFSSSPSDASEFPCPSCGDRSRVDGVISSCLECFLSGGELYKFQYGVSLSVFLAQARGGTCTFAPSDPAGAVLYRAEYLLQNGFGNYDIFKNNCEDFAIYCKTGLLISVGLSGQVSTFIGRIVNVGSGQASAFIERIGSGQASAFIERIVNVGSGQASAFIERIGSGQASAFIERIVNVGSGQASASIGRIASFGRIVRFGRSGQAASFKAAAGAISPLCYITTGLSGFTAVGCGIYCVSRIVSDVGVRHDVTKIPVEKLVALSGLDEPETPTETPKE